MGVSTRTYKKADGTTGTRLVGQNGSSQDTGGVTLFDVDGNALLGQATKANSIPVALSTEDAALLTTVAALSKAEDASHSSGDPGVMLLAVRKDTAAAVAGTDGDYIPLIVDANGRLHISAAQLPAALAANGGLKVEGVAGGTAQPVTPSLPTTALSTRVAINAASSGDNTLVALTLGQTIRVHKVFLVASGAVNIKFKDGASADFHPAIPLYAGGGMTLDFDGDPWFVTTAGNALVLNLSAAVQVSGVLYYSQS